MDFPVISPEIFSFTVPYFEWHIALRWYGLMYLFGFATAFWLGTRRSKLPGSPFTAEQLSDLLFNGFLGVVIGGRIGYVFFYQFDEFLKDPIYLIRIWEGGMSFHGGLLGVLVAFYLSARKLKLNFFTVADFIAPLVPPGLFFGRIGNFINAELWGREAGPDVPWAMRFYTDEFHKLRHPSQLYEALLEGLLLFIIIYWFSSKSRPRMAVSGVFALGYGAFRFIVEYFREPDAHLGLQALGLSRGQWLCVPVIVMGMAFLLMAYRRKSDK